MVDALKALFKQPYWVIALILGVALVALPCISIDKDFHLRTQSPNTFVPVVVGIALLLLSAVGFLFTLLPKGAGNVDEVSAGLDMTHVKEGDGVLWTTLSGCEIRVINGCIEDHPRSSGVAIVLPCNEYFDDRCVADTKSALGEYVNRVFEGRAQDFVALIKEEFRRKLGAGAVQQKTADERAESFGAGRCLLLTRPLGQLTPVALVSTTTQRAGEGLAA